MLVTCVRVWHKTVSLNVHTSNHLSCVYFDKAVGFNSVPLCRINTRANYDSPMSQ